MSNSKADATYHPRRPSHSVYRDIAGVYDYTPCWCAATADHALGEEEEDR